MPAASLFPTPLTRTRQRRPSRAEAPWPLSVKVAVMLGLDVLAWAGVVWGVPAVILAVAR